MNRLVAVSKQGIKIVMSPSYAHPPFTLAGFPPPIQVKGEEVYTFAPR